MSFRTSTLFTFLSLQIVLAYAIRMQKSTLAVEFTEPPVEIPTFASLNLNHLNSRIIHIFIHSNGRTTNGRTTYSRTTYNRPVSAMVCAINNMQCDYLTIHCDGMKVLSFSHFD